MRPAIESAAEGGAKYAKGMHPKEVWMAELVFTPVGFMSMCHNGKLEPPTAGWWRLIGDVQWEYKVGNQVMYCVSSIRIIA